jgi:hypothetical protein
MQFDVTRLTVIAYKGWITVPELIIGHTHSKVVREHFAEYLSDGLLFRRFSCYSVAVQLIPFPSSPLSSISEL